jgi:hypothetical protein
MAANCSTARGGLVMRKAPGHAHGRGAWQKSIVCVIANQVQPLEYPPEAEQCDGTQASSGDAQPASAAAPIAEAADQAMPEAELVG